MNIFKLREGTVYAFDLNGIAILNKKVQTHFLIGYPEAAIWSVLSGNYGRRKSVEMLKAILGKDEEATTAIIEQCITKWKSLNLIC
jgi:hypothetical protein